MGDKSAAWYRGGLSFECTQCGNCCTGFSGTVAVNDTEIAALAARLDLTEARFRSRYTRVLADGSISLKEKPNYDCVFYGRGHGCLVYEDRPQQCRDWPFWKSVIDTPESWAEEARTCPGMNKGRLYTLEHIEVVADRTP